ncbi:hypothetical protein Pmar_PMAR028680 [Perkinsus marinus ATCC 50983]|uniref:Uncharacterized protein n=1 Tax=Perkinsus marinus (strain ATCC 50983 / TXsc) TaxID=423536 RepID=C5K8K8_PERM5|nr:hypothetical protein Pmar_PMAR028680 [Perkinsus marinus ATCC 50983]EER19215.1 hypothetical protein Pmar_PMAR028680 [Perkinsus marinus ATCC 50983]|eukprot:XP_002787419.1 hypothetical protein Pmar_PMAR028680 [Perkinsus marinus ATCC 50983]
MIGILLSLLPILTVSFIRRAQESATMWDEYCQYLNGPASACAGSSCTQGGQACGDGPPLTTTVGPEVGDADEVRRACDSYCQVLNGAASFCKWWFESPVCQYGDHPCGTMEICGAPPQFDRPVGDYSSEWHDYCKALNGPSSRCDGTCTSGGQPCGSGQIPSLEVTTVAPPVVTTVMSPRAPDVIPGSKVIVGCDDYCKRLNGETSFCKWWFMDPVCQFGDQPCADAQTCNSEGVPMAAQVDPVPPVDTISSIDTMLPVETLPPVDTIPPVDTVPPVDTLPPVEYVPPFDDVPLVDAVPPVDNSDGSSDPTAPGDAVQQTCDVFCAQLNGENSFCKMWHTNPVCQHGNQPCGTLDLCGEPVNGVSVDVSRAPAVLPSGDGQHYAECDKMCQSLNDATSYCKWWMNTPVCQHGDQPCGDASVCQSETWPSPPAPQLPPGAHSEASAECDTMCKELNDDSSYCKWWRSVPVCHGGDQPCGPGSCNGVAVVSTRLPYSMPTEVVVITTQAPPPPPPRAVTDAPVVPVASGAHSMPNAKCDAYCSELNGPGSYCKWWKDIPVCKGGDQPCGAEVCDDPTTR